MRATMQRSGEQAPDHRRLRPLPHRAKPPSRSPPPGSSTDRPSPGVRHATAMAHRDAVSTTLKDYTPEPAQAGFADPQGPSAQGFNPWATVAEQPLNY